MICWCWAWFDEHEYDYVGLLALRVVDSHAPTVIEVLRIATLDYSFDLRLVGEYQFHIVGGDLIFRGSAGI